MTESGSASFGDAAGEMANETEVEAPTPGASASAGHRPPTADEHGDDISGVDDWVEEGGPLEPQDLADGSAPDEVDAAGVRRGAARGAHRPTCSGCRPSTPTTASASTATAS